MDYYSVLIDICVGKIKKFWRKISQYLLFTPIGDSSQQFHKLLRAGRALLWHVQVRR
jgi:hypothetical protein